MYAETGAAMRTALAELLRQHRVQHRLGDSIAERAAAGHQVRRYRHSVLTWCGQALESVSPMTFVNQPPRRSNPFRAAVAGAGASPAGELARSIDVALAGDTSRCASVEQLTVPTGHPHVELWRDVAKAAVLAEHDTAPAIAATMTAPQAQAVVADVAAIVQALVVLDQRHSDTPEWQFLKQSGHLGWAALAAALDVSLGQPDYTVDRLGWHPPVKPIPGPPRPGILGVLQAEHNLVAKLGRSLPSTINLRYVIDSQRLLSHHLAPFAGRIDGRLADHWDTRADTYATLQRQFRSISGLLGTGGAAAAAEGGNAVARLRSLPADTVVEPRVLGGFQLLFDRLDRHMSDVIEDGITQLAFAQRARLPRPAETDDLVPLSRDQMTPVDPTQNRDLVDTVRSLRPWTGRNRPPAAPGTTRADLHAALIHRAATRDRGTAPRL
ncbi:hypothetical protein ASC77_23370 [Nocardioides sp. Root1257]|uniref:hypothetical protein n=1 Tax=unclassified Nocardioides TaxID=2615069 RepID=UPI0006F751CA|nr:MULTISPECIES: hypothetical protein [unclassified Nocardioides]KQW42611.1 hypothetical protein ASC77_23370 [Nocardioides sp. Root1257]KRC39869.1 hypothetical protein ASE24_23165 [Nocardioides sp. Root224]